MSLVQYYESVVRDNRSNVAARFIIIPRRSLAPPSAVITGSIEHYMPQEPEHIISTLGGWHIKNLSSDQLIPIVAGIISEAPELTGKIIDTSFEASRAYEVDRLLSDYRFRFSPEDIRFAEVLVHESVIPFEQSPLHAVSLAEIAKAGGVATGAYVGFLIAGSSPLLLVTVPAGMIICGAAAGIGEGLRRRFEALLSRT